MKVAKIEPSKTAVLVLGMHRSGTSALAGSLQQLGVPLGPRLIAPGEDNPGGYFEHAAAVTAHEVLLAELDNGWECVLPLPTNWVESAAAERATTELRGLINEDFGNAALWAVKDPRLSRLLPLWHRVLAEQSVRPAHVFMLRHPDEVAASLAKRDGIGGGYAYLLWLRHYLDAERDSRGYVRAVVTYDQLLADPVASLQSVSEVLDVSWPVPPAQGVVGEILDSSKRHHIASVDVPGRGLRAAALELFSEVQAASRSGQWPDGESQRRVLERWTNRLIPWIGGLSSALAKQRRTGYQAAEQHMATDLALAEAQDLSLQRLRDLKDGEARIRGSEHLALTRLQELEAMAAQLAQTHTALEMTEAQSLSRLQELEAMAARLAQTDAALETTEARSLSRLQELEAMDARLAQTDTALKMAEAQSLSRLQELEAMAARLAQTDTALEMAEAQSLSRLQELEAMDARLAQTDTALKMAEAQSLSRLQELEAMAARLARTDVALVATEAESLARLQEMEALSARLAETEAALAATEAQSIQRLLEIQATWTRVDATDKALAHAEHLSIERLREIEGLQRMVSVANAALSSAESVIEARLRDLDEMRTRLFAAETSLADTIAKTHQLEAQITLRDAKLEAVTSSLSWRLSRPLRWLGRLVGRSGEGWETR